MLAVFHVRNSLAGFTNPERQIARMLVALAVRTLLAGVIGSERQIVCAGSIKRFASSDSVVDRRKTRHPHRKDSQHQLLAALPAETISRGAPEFSKCADL